MNLLTPKYKVELIEQDDQHFYSVDGRGTYLPGSTGPLDRLSKPALVPWAAKETALYMAKILKKVCSIRTHTGVFSERFINTLIKRSKKQPKIIKQKAAQTGSSIHKLLDILIKDPTSTFVVKNKEIMTLIESCALWIRTEQLKIIQGETAVASLQYGYGGSVDCFAMDSQGRIWLVDFKTGRQIYKEYAYQVAGAYSQAVRETYGLDYNPYAVIVRLDKDQVKYERKEVLDTENAFKGFKAALDAYHAEKINLFARSETVKLKKEKKKNDATAARV